MTIASEITRIHTNIANAYTAASGKGATLPAIQNSDNLATCIGSISGGSTNPITVSGTFSMNSSGQFPDSQSPEEPTTISIDSDFINFLRNVRDGFSDTPPQVKIYKDGNNIAYAEIVGIGTGLSTTSSFPIMDYNYVFSKSQTYNQGIRIVFFMPYSYEYMDEAEYTHTEYGSYNLYFDYIPA
jgi:hypothetical protein